VSLITVIESHRCALISAGTAPRRVNLSLKLCEALLGQGAVKADWLVSSRSLPAHVLGFLTVVL
jgi:hypothetical protein